MKSKITKKKKIWVCPQQIFYALIFLQNSSFETNNFKHCSKKISFGTACCRSSKLQWSTIHNCSVTAILPLSQTNHFIAAHPGVPISNFNYFHFRALCCSQTPFSSRKKGCVWGGTWIHSNSSLIFIYILAGLCLQRDKNEICGASRADPGAAAGGPRPRTTRRPQLSWKIRNSRIFPFFFFNFNFFFFYLRNSLL